MISRSGIALFILGNKVSNDLTVLADGVIEEFEIAKSKRLTIVPVGSTGYAAKKIWDEVSENFETFYPKPAEDLRKAFDDLNLEGDPIEIARRVNKFIGMLSARVE